MRLCKKESSIIFKCVHFQTYIPKLAVVGDIEGSHEGNRNFRISTRAKLEQMIAFGGA